MLAYCLLLLLLVLMLCSQAYDQWEAEEAAAAQQLIKQQQKAKARGKAAAKGAKGGKGKKAASPWSDDGDDGDDDVEMMDSDDEFVVRARLGSGCAVQVLRAASRRAWHDDGGRSAVMHHAAYPLCACSGMKTAGDC
jgi:hypothetical protein